jgi:C-terminal processing protease CtpA/Prc
VSSGFSFDDGNQVLVSVQKPLGIVLEQNDGFSKEIVVVSVDKSRSACRAGVQVGDVLVAVQNANVEQESLDRVLELIGRAPRVVNLRFARI